MEKPPEEIDAETIFIVTAVRDYQDTLTDQQRIEFWEKIQEGYCECCGRADPTCQCWNDN